MEVLNLKLNEIHPYEKNPRNNKDAVDGVAASIREFGFKVPIIIDKDNIIVAGHTRFSAAKKLGLEQVPCIKADDLTPEQIKAFRLADNKVAEKAEWDFELLGEELADITMDMEQFGFELLGENIEILEDDVPDIPKVAVEVLIGHRVCHIIIESSEWFSCDEIRPIVKRIAGDNIELDLMSGNQDVHLAKNQNKGFKCGDNGIFKGMPLTDEDKKLSEIARTIYAKFPSDGKYILDGNKLIICQSNASNDDLFDMYPFSTINPLGEWTGGTDVDSGATNRKLGSDMARSVTGGGLHGKDLSKADVSVNIYAFLKAQETNQPVELSCAIGDTTIDGKPYSEIVEIARNYINQVGGFEKFAEWGLF